MRVLRGPILRALAFLLALGSVAMLGRNAEERSRLGVEPDANALRAEATERAGIAAQAGREAERPAPPPPSPCPPATPGPSGAPSSATSATTSDGKVILNEAGVEELKRLPGVGQRRAEAILALREKLGKFKKMTDLLRVRGIGPKSLARFREVAVLDRPVEAPEVKTAVPAPAPP